EEEGVPFYTILDQTYGIAPDAAVSLRGVVVGVVSNVGITRDGMVRVDIAMSNIYRDFYTNGSYLTVDTNIAINTLLTGSGLIFHPAQLDNGAMDRGKFIPTEPPQGLATLLEEVDIRQLTDQLTEIVANAEQITTEFNENQATLYASFDNLEKITENLAQVTDGFPETMASVNNSLASLESSLTNMDQLVDNADEDLQATLHNAAELSSQATDTLAEAESLFAATTPVMEQMPTVLLTTDQTLQNISDLAEEMSGSWLFGGDSDETPEPGIDGPSSHSHDTSLYPQNPEPDQ
ncbi:MAG: MlaD family protein, partial [Pseudomonadota bacterium]